MWEVKSYVKLILRIMNRLSLFQSRCVLFLIQSSTDKSKMGFDFNLLGPIVICGISAWLFFLFFRHYGMFKLPWYSWGPMCLYTIIILVMTFALLPYDISIHMFEEPDEYKDKLLKKTLEIFYWVSWGVGFGLMPILTTVWTFNYAFSPGKKVWYAIRYNIMWYSAAAIFCLICVIIVGASEGGMTLKSVKSLCIAVVNGYGLLLLVLFLGYGFVALPRHIWRLADPNDRIRYYYNLLHEESKLCCKAIANGAVVFSACTAAIPSIKRYYKEVFIKNIAPRILTLDSFLRKKDLPGYLYEDAAPDKCFSDLMNTNWKEQTITELETFVYYCDYAIVSMSESHHYISELGDQLEDAFRFGIESKRNPQRAFLIKWGQRFGSVLLGLYCLHCVWAEFTLLIERPRWNLFHYFAHIPAPTIVGQLFLTAPILGTYIIIGGWSMTKMNLGLMYRFIPGHSNDNTLYYWIVFLCRLVPSISYHYILQIEAYSTSTYKFLGDMKTIAFLGTYYNQYLVIFMSLVMILVFFNVWDKILDLCGIERFKFGEYTANRQTVGSGQQILKTIRPDLMDMVEECSVSTVSPEQPLLSSVSVY